VNQLSWTINSFIIGYKNSSVTKHTMLSFFVSRLVILYVYQYYISSKTKSNPINLLFPQINEFARKSESINASFDDSSIEAL
jgi:hypothetical protein